MEHPIATEDPCSEAEIGQLQNSPVPPPEWEAMPRGPGDLDHGLQTSYKMISPQVQSMLARKHNRNKQFFRLLGKVMLRFFSSVILSAAMIACFKYYENIKVLSDSQKNIFNLLSTGIYLTMGLNLAGAFKEYATMLRWRLLARKPHNLLEVDLILGLSSLMKVFKLSIHSLKTGKIAAFLACLSWILVNFIGRVSVALTGLAYSYDSAGAVSSYPGTVRIADTRFFWPSADTSRETPSLGAQFQTAHLYGEFSSIMVTDGEDDVAPKKQQDMKFNNKTGEWTYRFKEYNPMHHNLYVTSNRSITVSATCIKYNIIDGVDGSSPAMTFFNHTINTNVTWDISDMGAGSTIYAVPFKRNNTMMNKCALGPRCAVVLGFQFLPRNNSALNFRNNTDKFNNVDLEMQEDSNPDKDFRKKRKRKVVKRQIIKQREPEPEPEPLLHLEFGSKKNDNASKNSEPPKEVDLITPLNEGDGTADDSASLFECHVYISPVQNARVPEHELSDSLAWIAAGAIGLDGFTDDGNHMWMFHQYHKGTMFGQRKGGDPREIAKLVGRFAAGVIGTMDIAGPKLPAFGNLAWRGVLFKVDWNRTVGILFGICLVQMVLGLLSCVVSNTAFVKDDSYLSAARLLRPVVERLGPSGCALSGAEIAKTLGSRMVYGVRVDKSGLRHHLDLGEDIRPSECVGRGFPEGWYDGVVEGMVPFGRGAGGDEDGKRLGNEHEERVMLVKRKLKVD